MPSLIGRSRVKKLKLAVKVGELVTFLGEVKIEPYGKPKELPTIRVTPCCHVKPQACQEPPFEGRYAAYCYVCPQCGAKYSDWRQLIEVDARTLNPIVEMIPGSDKGVMYLYAFDEYELEGIELVDIETYTIIPLDSQTKKNVIAFAKGSGLGGKILIGKWHDGRIWHVAYFDLTPQGRVVLKEVIPANILEVTSRPLDVSVSEVSEKDIEAARQLIDKFVKSEASPGEVLSVKDWRTGEQPKPEEAKKPKVPSLQEVLAKLEEQQ